MLKMNGCINILYRRKIFSKKIKGFGCDPFGLKIAGNDLKKPKLAPNRTPSNCDFSLTFELWIRFKKIN